MPYTDSGLYFAEDVNSRRERMRAWKTKADTQAKRLEEELQKIDANLEVDFVDPKVANLPLKDREIGVIPGRWHVIRRNPGGVDAWFPICGANKEYRDPELAVVDEMKRMDLWRPGALKELRDKQLAEDKASQRRQDLDSEQMVDELVQGFEAASRMRHDSLTKNTSKKRGIHA